MTDSSLTEAVEPRPDEHAVSERILILAPSGDDGPLTAEILRQHKLLPTIVPDATALAREIERGAGAVLITSEAFEDFAGGSILRDVLDRQEPWSEMPMVLFGSGHDTAAAASQATELLGTRAYIIQLERPLAIATFLMATDAALRSRRRQYEVKRLLEALAESAVEVARANQEATRSKDEFLATLGHELRSPMTAIRGWIQLLQDDTLSPLDAATALAMIESSTRVQSRIIEDLMDISRIIAGKAMIEPAKVELTAIVERVIATFRPAAVEKKIELTGHLPTAPLFAWADESRLQQIGWNLVSNAIKFTPSGGSVDVTLERENATAVLRIRDTGEGISAGLLPYIFERYRQEERGAEHAQPGLGLGLSIVCHLVESHGGTIEAFSEGEGKGAELVVTLPLLE